MNNEKLRFRLRSAAVQAHDRIQSPYRSTVVFNHRTDARPCVSTTRKFILLSIFILAACNDNNSTTPAATSTEVISYKTLFSATTVLEPEVQTQSETALYTYLADRARDRHAREDQFQQYDHYLTFYWEHRTAAIEIVDRIPFGGNSITFNVTTQWRLSPIEAELRFFYRGHNTVAEYHNNGVMTKISDTYYTRSVSHNNKTGTAIKVGDRLEFELSQFLEAVPNFRNNYYGTTFLYIVGKGIVPWEARGTFQDFSTELEDSFAIAEKALLGGKTTLPYQYSAEPDHHFQQMPTNLAPINAQKFVLGRRVHHTDFENGRHDESPDNPIFTQLRDKLGSNYLNNSCVACHQLNGRAIPPALNTTLDQYLFLVADSGATSHSRYGSVLHTDARKPQQPEGNVVIQNWTENNNGLRTPNYNFTPETPALFSARIAPQLVGLGLLEAITEADIVAKADPADTNNDGISGRVHIVTNPVTNNKQIGRFGWKASKASLLHQITSTLNTDMGVPSRFAPNLDCGTAETNCGNSTDLLAEQHIDNLTAYVALLGIRPQRDIDDSSVVSGKQLFTQVNCSGCHTPEYTTSPYHPHAELRNQKIQPYTDLLLHNMGTALADNLGEGQASGAEWRTPPLWGIGLSAEVSGAESYLHDGRARSLTEAILWHGGEAQQSKQDFVNLTTQQQQDIVTFLKSL